MDQHFDDFFENAMKASDKGRFLKLPRCQKNLKYNFDGLYSYNTRISLLDLPAEPLPRLADGQWAAPPTTTMPVASWRTPMASERKCLINV